MDSLIKEQLIEVFSNKNAPSPMINANHRIEEETQDVKAFFKSPKRSQHSKIEYIFPYGCFHGTVYTKSCHNVAIFSTPNVFK
jgi:hypothetical protein